MIDYMYSRMIATISSIALVALVVSASLGATDRAAESLAEQIASDIRDLVEVAIELEGESYSQELRVDDGGMRHDLRVILNRTYVTVENGMHACSKAFGHPINLVSDGRDADRLIAPSGSTLVVRASRNIFEPVNSVSIEVLTE